MNTARSLFLAIALTLCLAAFSEAQVMTGGTFTITQSVIAGGGGESTGGTFKIEDTIGQAAAGTRPAGSTYVFQNGFWGEPNAAPAAAISVSGKVTTPLGQGLRNVTVSLIDALGIRRTATTSSFGLYSFENVAEGDNYIMTVTSKRYRFTPRLLSIRVTLTNLDFTGLE